MKKLFLFTAIGLLVGLGASTAAVVFLGGGDTLLDGYAAVIGSDSTAAPAGIEPSDSVAVDSLAPPPAEMPGEVDAEPAAPEADAAGAAADSVLHAPAPDEETGAAGAGDAVVALADAAPGIDADRLAKLFGSMQAREAARVLEHLDDAEVGIILGKLGNREAAAILGSLAPERAALISRSVIRGRRSSQ